MTNDRTTELQDKARQLRDRLVSEVRAVGIAWNYSEGLDVSDKDRQHLNEVLEDLTGWTLDNFESAHDARVVYSTLLEAMQGAPLSVDRRVIVDVTLYTGGPAGGVEFEAETDEIGYLSYVKARAWHQDWWTERVYEPMPDDAGSALFALLSLDTM